MISGLGDAEIKATYNTIAGKGHTTPGPSQRGAGACAPEDCNAEAAGVQHRVGYCRTAGGPERSSSAGWEEEQSSLTDTLEGSSFGVAVLDTVGGLAVRHNSEAAGTDTGPGLSKSVSKELVTGILQDRAKRAAPLAFVVARVLCLIAILSLTFVSSKAQATKVIAQVGQLFEERHDDGARLCDTLESQGQIVEENEGAISATVSFVFP